MEQHINVDRMEQAVALFGNFDENIRLIEQQYHVSIFNRDSDIKISGEQPGVMTAVKAINGLHAKAEELKKILNARGQDVVAMIELDVPEDELMTRLLKRGQESGRADDNEETIKKRLVVYHSQTAPLIDWYKNDGKYQHINGLGSMEGIFAEIAEAIDKI